MISIVTMINPCWGDFPWIPETFSGFSAGVLSWADDSKVENCDSSAQQKVFFCSDTVVVTLW
jgi:hypothetical protein